MSGILDEFLALRRAAGTGPSVAGQPEPEERLEERHDEPIVPEEGQPVLPRPSTAICPNPDKSVSEPSLASYFRDLLAAHPSASPVKDRAGLAEYLALGIVHRYGDPKRVDWLGTATPLRQNKRDKALWLAKCPAGHLTDEAVESHQVVGWACESCQRIYDATECRLVPRPVPGEELQ